ncbi:MAG: hypothetical protein WD645_03555, partial [Dehalococcoidia bacterium]
MVVPQRIPAGGVAGGASVAEAPMPAVQVDNDLAGILAGLHPSPGIAATAYDTAWVASVPSAKDPRQPRFPLALLWLRSHQHADGSWGGAVRYEHDRLL